MFEQVYRHTTKIIAAIYLVMVALLLWAGTQADGYLINVRHITEAQPYPTRPVLIALLVLAVPYAMFAWALRSHSWGRVLKLLVCLIPDVPLTLLIGVTILHAPPYHVFFFVCRSLADAISAGSFAIIYFAGLMQEVGGQYMN